MEHDANANDASTKDFKVKVKTLRKTITDNAKKVQNLNKAAKQVRIAFRETSLGGVWCLVDSCDVDDVGWQLADKRKKLNASILEKEEIQENILDEQKKIWQQDNEAKLVVEQTDFRLQNLRKELASGSFPWNTILLLGVLFQIVDRARFAVYQVFALVTSATA